MLGASAVEDPEAGEGGLGGERASFRCSSSGLSGGLGGQLPLQGGGIGNHAKREACRSARRLVVFGIRVTTASTASTAVTSTFAASAHIAFGAIVTPLAGPVVPLLPLGVEIVAFSLIVIVLLAVGAVFHSLVNNARVARMGSSLNTIFDVPSGDQRLRALRGVLVW